MPLTTEQIKIVKTSLSQKYGEADFNTTKKTITVFVDNADRTYRKGVLQEIQKAFSGAPFNAKYSGGGSGGKTGAVKISGLSVEVKPSIKAKPISTGKTKFKPSDIVPSIVNEWMNAEEIIANTTKYIKNAELSDEVEKQIIKLLQETGKDSNTAIPFDAPKDLVPSEFFEILTAVKLAVLLRKNDPKTRKVLGIPEKMDLSRSKIKIYIPQQANYALIDYFISVTASEKKDEDSAIKISVKSKVKSPKPNTVKFKDVFSREKDVSDWYKGLNRPLQQKQKGPKIITETALGVYGMGKGKAMFGVPIVAMINLLKHDKLKISALIKQKIKSDITVQEFESILKEIHSKITTVSNNTDLSNVLDKKLYLKASTLIQASFSKTGGKEVKNIVFNIAHVCERLLEAASIEGSVTGYDFYQMFFDEVLTKKKIAYAVASKKGKSIQYNFYSLVNFAQEYASWLSLRTKNFPNEGNDVIGIDV